MSLMLPLMQLARQFKLVSAVHCRIMITGRPCGARRGACGRLAACFSGRLYKSPSDVPRETYVSPGTRLSGDLIQQKV